MLFVSLSRVVLIVMETNASDQEHLLHNTQSVLLKLLKKQGINCCKTGRVSTKLADNHQNVYKTFV